MTAPEGIRLLLSDVDGTLVTRDKVLTPRTRDAVLRLKARGIRFAITSSRPARGMAMFVDPFALDTPLAAFNGGQYVDDRLTVLEDYVLPRDIAATALDLIQGKGIDVWVFTGLDWLVTNPDHPRVAHEIKTIRYDPVVVKDFDDRLDRINKLVGVSDDFDKLRQCEAELQGVLGDRANAKRSQDYYLDVTHRLANKGAVLDHLSDTLAIPREAIAAIGDGMNDIAMFERAGFAIAMGNGADEVKESADTVTDSCDADGFAKAIERLFLEAK